MKKKLLALLSAALMAVLLLPITVSASAPIDVTCINLYKELLINV